MSRTLRQRRGLVGETAAAEHLERQGWSVLARNVFVPSGNGRDVRRDEIDLLCFDPGPPPEVVAVEVRSARSSAFGAPEERVDGRKVSRLYRALSALDDAVVRSAGLGALPRRVDLLIVDRRTGRYEVRHLRGLTPR